MQGDGNRTEQNSSVAARNLLKFEKMDFAKRVYAINDQVVSGRKVLLPLNNNVGEWVRLLPSLTLEHRRFVEGVEICSVRLSHVFDQPSLINMMNVRPTP